MSVRNVVQRMTRLVRRGVWSEGQWLWRTRPARRQLAGTRGMAPAEIELLESRRLLSAPGFADLSAAAPSEAPEGSRGRSDGDCKVPPWSAVPFDQRLLVRFTDEVVDSGQAPPTVPGTFIVRSIDLVPGLYFIYVSEMFTQEQALAAYRASPLVKYAEPDQIISVHPTFPTTFGKPQAVFGPTDSEVIEEPVAQFAFAAASSFATTPEETSAVGDELLANTIGTLLSVEARPEAIVSTSSAVVLSQPLETESASEAESPLTLLDSYFADEDPIELLSPSLNHSLIQR